ncbi:MAG: diguanylate cyclase [Deltaproteobacteria bacterium]|nr:MAG: diguanylate cyclase [Deltaproteobacteria bacterium]
MSINHKNRLRNSFAEVVKRQAGELAELVRDIQSDPDVRDALCFELERIEGTAASLGLTPIERAAREALTADDDAAFLERVERLVDACRALEGVHTLFRPVIVIGADVPAHVDLAVDLRAAEDVAEALALAEAEDPAAFVVPIDHLDALCARVEGALKAVPIYACGPGDALDLRLAAARRGAAGYVGTPVRLPVLLDLVRARAREADPPPYRVLVVESDLEVARTVVGALSGPHREVHRVARAGELLPELDAFRPELVLLAARGDDFEGGAIASVIHGHDVHGGVPVLIMADGVDVEQAALVAGADDIIRKPIDPERLRSRVLPRLRRAREAEAARIDDRLTGVLSRRALLRLADREIGLARRTDAPLAVILVDVDGMKGINEAHGLVTGDAALQELARVLGRTFRETDLIGRVGGDSFAVLLPSCTARAARKRVQAVGEAMRAWGAEQGIKDLDVSVGIADTTDTVADVMARADRALVQARNDGGGRVHVDGFVPAVLR